MNANYNHIKVFGHAFPPDGEMGPYPLSDTMPPDGEMGPYPLSDNTNLLGPSSYNVSLYRNYGSNYGTNYASSNSYTAKYSNKKSYASATPSSYVNSSNSGYCRDTSETCQYRSHCSGSGSNTKCNTPVPTRRCYAKRERDSFRRHSAHGRMSSASQGI